MTLEKRPCENIVGKRENARYAQFLLFPRRFQKTCTAKTPVHQLPLSHAGPQ